MLLTILKNIRWTTYFRDEIKIITNKENVLNDKSEKKNTVKNNFFYLKHFNMEDPDPYIMRNYFQKYILPIFKVQPIINDMEDTDTLYILCWALSVNNNKSIISITLLTWI